MTLKDLPIGKTATVTSVGGEGALRQHFLDMGLIPKADVTMVKFAPMGDPVEVRIHGYELTLRLADAEKIEIDKIRDTITEPMRPQDARPIFHPGNQTSAGFSLSFKEFGRLQRPFPSAIIMTVGKRLRKTV